MLSDRDPRVRGHALHVIACGRCKEDVLPRPIAILREDPFYQVRALAVEVVGFWAHEDSRTCSALEVARDRDPKPMVRTKARWFAPGGVIFS